MNSVSIQELFKCRHLKSVKVDDHEILKKYPFLEFEWKFQYVAVKTLVKNLLFTCNKLYDDDQIKLLKNCWYELLLVIMCRRTIEHETEENGLMFFCGVLDNKDVEEYCKDLTTGQSTAILNTYKTIMTDVVKSMTSHSRNQINCLLAAFMYDNNIEGLENSEEVRLLRETVYVVLYSLYPEVDGECERQEQTNENSEPQVKSPNLMSMETYESKFSSLLFIVPTMKINAFTIDKNPFHFFAPCPNDDTLRQLLA